MPGQVDLDTGRRCRVDNGMIATITPSTTTSRVSTSPSRPADASDSTGDYVHSGAVDHGYATTIHKAQGVTCDHIHVVGPAGLYREAAYVALSRARRSAHLYATTRDAATIGEPAHTTGIPLPTENLDDPEADIINALTQSRAKQFVTRNPPTSTHRRPRQHLQPRPSQRPTTPHQRRHRRSQKPDSPTRAQPFEELRLAEEHRSPMNVGGRVNARDWDNVGTIERLHDTIGNASVRFATATANTPTPRPSRGNNSSRSTTRTPPN